MSVEVRCPGCGKGWVLQSAAGGEMICPGCMTRIGLDRPAPSPPAPSAPAPPQPRPTAPRTAPAPASGREGEIVCPRCNFHFRSADRPAPAAEGQRKTVLVVDDLEYFRQIALDALSPVFEVRTAETHDEARELLAGGGIDLMVLDLTLEGGQGGRQLLTQLDPKPCPILIFTAEDESEMYGESWAELARLGADDVVIKGMNVADLLVRKAGLLLGTPVDAEGD